MSKTFRRDRLVRLVEAGKVTLASSYRFDDMDGATRTQETTPVPVAISPADWQDRKQGVCYVRRDEFMSYGRAILNDNGTVTLYVHSNSNYTFNIQN